MERNIKDPKPKIFDPCASNHAVLTNIGIGLNLGQGLRCLLLNCKIPLQLF